MFANIKNGQIIRKKYIIQTYTKFSCSFLDILWDEGFINGYTVQNNKILIYLKYTNGIPCINSLKLISKPGQKIYYTLNQLWKIKAPTGILIISTNKGLMTLRNCKKLKKGGEPFIIVK